MSKKEQLRQPKRGKRSLKPFLPKTAEHCRKCTIPPKYLRYEWCNLCLMNRQIDLTIDLFEMLLFKLERIRVRLESIDNKQKWSVGL